MLVIDYLYLHTYLLLNTCYPIKIFYAKFCIWCLESVFPFLQDVSIACYADALS